jgi:hypothetical protein
MSYHALRRRGSPEVGWAVRIGWGYGVAIRWNWSMPGQRVPLAGPIGRIGEVGHVGPSSPKFAQVGPSRPKSVQVGEFGMDVRIEVGAS